MVTAVKSSLYQTIIPSFNVMSRPSMPVKPARKTAICNWRKAFFIHFTGPHFYHIAERSAKCEMTYHIFTFPHFHISTFPHYHYLITSLPNSLNELSFSMFFTFFL